jgi:glucose-1-phosphate cytidylyltransferase
MKIYSHYGHTDFVICLGYKGYLIKEYFANYFLHTSDVTFDLKTNKMQVHRNVSEPWSVTLIDTGEGAMTGGRLKRVRDHLGDAPFCMTYGDGVSDVDVNAVFDLHKQQNALITMTAVQPPGRFGAIEFDGPLVRGFHEKPPGDGNWVNGGFFIVDPSVLDSIDGDDTVWEAEPLESAAAAGRLAAYSHRGFWHAMDTLRDRNHLEDLWASGKAPWKLWA